MANEGGYGERDPLMEHTDDQDEETGDVAAGGNETTRFETPVDSSTPNGKQRQTTTNRPGEPPSYDVLPEIPGGFASTIFTAENELLKEFPFADKSKLKYNINDKGRLQVGLIDPKKPHFLLTTEIRGKSGEYQINN